MTAGGSSGSSSPGRPPFALIVSITVTGIMANTLVAPATPDIVADFGVGATGVGLILAAGTAPGILLAPVIGVLADRFGRRELLVPCLALFGVSGGLASLAPSFAALLVLRLLQGAGAAGLINLAVVIIGDHWDGVERARMIGRNAAALTASIAVLPPLGGALADLGGWQASFTPFWLALVTAGVVWWRLPAHERGDRTLRQQLADARPYLRAPAVRGSIAMAFTLFVLVFGLFLAVLPVYLERHFGVGPTVRGLILGAPAITSTITALNLGRLRRRLSGRVVVAAGWGFLAAGLVALAVAPSVPLLLVGPFLYGIGEGLTIPTLQDAVAGAAPATSRGSVVAVFVGVTRTGQTVGPLVGGAAVEHVGASVLFAIGAVVAATTGMVLRLAGWRVGQEVAIDVTK